MSKNNLENQVDEEEDSIDYDIEGDTIPDEEFNQQNSLKNRDAYISWPNKQSSGPNINLHFLKKRFSNPEEKHFFYDKIRKKKKTELCKNWEIYKDCFYKDECCFAHGIEELRQNNNLPTYRTKECKSFNETMTCPFGARCNYKHII